MCHAAQGGLQPEGLAGLKIKQRLEEVAKLGGRDPWRVQALDSAQSYVSGGQAAQVGSLIAEAQRLIDQQDFAEARKKLLQVNQHDEDNPQACFYLGLLAGLVEHNNADARKYFVRARKSEADAVACLNNLALVTIRTGDVRQALSHWKEAIGLGSSPDVAHNLGLLFHLADRKRVMVPAGTREALEKDLNSPPVTAAASGRRWTSFRPALVLLPASTTNASGHSGCIRNKPP